MARMMLDSRMSARFRNVPEYMALRFASSQS